MATSGRPEVVDQLPHAHPALERDHLEIVPSPSPSAAQDELLGVAVLSGSYAWAVGDQGDKTLIERWDGTAWNVQPSPN